MEIKYKLNSVENFRLYGFATGSYNCTCSDCGNGFLGDKRAFQCLECAIKGAEELAEAALAEKPKEMACITGKLCIHWPVCKLNRYCGGEFYRTR